MTDNIARSGTNTSFLFPAAQPPAGSPGRKLRRRGRGGLGLFFLFGGGDFEEALVHVEGQLFGLAGEHLHELAEVEVEHELEILTGEALTRGQRCLAFFLPFGVRLSVGGCGFAAPQRTEEFQLAGFQRGHSRETGWF